MIDLCNIKNWFSKTCSACSIWTSSSAIKDSHGSLNRGYRTEVIKKSMTARFKIRNWWAANYCRRGQVCLVFRRQSRYIDVCASVRLIIHLFMILVITHFIVLSKIFHCEKPLRPILPSPIKPATQSKYGASITIAIILNGTGDESLPVHRTLKGPT